VNGWNIEIQMSPESNATGVGYVKGRIGLASIKLTIGGPENSGWKEEPFLHPEPRIMTSNQETREGIEKAEKNAQTHPPQASGGESVNAGTAPLGWHKVDAGPFSILAPPRWEFHQLTGESWTHSHTANQSAKEVAARSTETYSRVVAGRSRGPVRLLVVSPRPSCGRFVP
jgi:hypothetical protein